MRENRKELQELLREQKKTNRTLDYWSSMGLFVTGMVSGHLGKSLIVRVLSYALAVIAIVWKCKLFVDDIEDIMDEPDDDEEMYEIKE